MVLTWDFVIVSLHEVILRQLQDQGKQHEQLARYIVPAATMKVCDNPLVLLEDRMSRRVVVFANVLGKVHQLHVVLDIGAVDRPLPGLRLALAADRKAIWLTAR